MGRTLCSIIQPSCSVSYSVSKTFHHGCYHGIISNSKKSSYAVKRKELLNVFVNEVLESKKQEVVRYQENKTYQFARYSVNATTEIDSDKTFEKDSNGIKIKTF